MNFGQALELLKAGKKVFRENWNGKGMFLFLVPGAKIPVGANDPLGVCPGGGVINYRSHIDMRTASGDIVPWVASQSDLLEVDWKEL